MDHVGAVVTNGLSLKATPPGYLGNDQFSDLGVLQAHAEAKGGIETVRRAGVVQLAKVVIGVFEGFASFMAEAAMKNSAKARLGTDSPKISKVNTRCQWKTVNFECHARAQACK